MNADAITGFLEAMAAAGVRPLDSIAGKLAGGALVRFRADGDKPGRLNGAAQVYADGVPAGWFHHHRLGIKGKWRANGVRVVDCGAGADYARQRLLREAERRTADEAGAIHATRLWEAGRPASAHPYLVRKAMGPDGLREAGGGLLVPMRDLDGKLWNVQRIAPDGFKLFMPGARVDGLAWWRGEPGETFAIGEGVATMAAVHAATGLCTVAAFTAGYLARVAGLLRSEHPKARLILCADDDSAGQTNVGVIAATKAAWAVNGLVARPPRPPGWPADKGHDFDDSYRALGPDAVRRALGCTSMTETPR
jgi:putative DNA primase/helicase